MPWLCVYMSSDAEPLCPVITGVMTSRSTMMAEIKIVLNMHKGNFWVASVFMMGNLQLAKYWIICTYLHVHVACNQSISKTRREGVGI